MIQAKFSENTESKSITLTVNGHAGQAAAGQDIICSSASILMYTVAQMAQYMYSRHQLKKKPHIVMNDGNASITVKPKEEHYGEALHAYFVAQVGYSLLAHNYPQYVDLTMFGTAE